MFWPWLYVALSPWIPEVFAIFLQKKSFTFFSFPFKQFFLLFFCSLPYFSFSLVSNISLSLKYFSNSCNNLWNWVGKISISYIAFEIILVILSYLPWPSSLVASWFSCFTVFILKYSAREKIRLVSHKANPACKTTLISNAAIETPPIINFNFIRSLSIMLVIVLNLYWLYLAAFYKIQFHQANIPQFQLIFLRHACGSCGAIVFRSGYILLVLLPHIFIVRT